MAATGNPRVVLRIVDMSSMASVRSLAEEILAAEERLDVLVNNAGVTGKRSMFVDCKKAQSKVNGKSIIVNL